MCGAKGLINVVLYPLNLIVELIINIKLTEFGATFSSVHADRRRYSSRSHRYRRHPILDKRYRRQVPKEWDSEAIRTETQEILEDRAIEISHSEGQT